MTSKAWRKTVIELYENPQAIERPIDTENSTVRKIARSVEESPESVSKSVSNLYHSGLLIESEEGLCLGPDGFAEARSRKTQNFERNRGLMMVIVTVALAISSVIQALGGPEEYGIIGMGLIGIVYILLTISAYAVSLKLANS